MVTTSFYLIGLIFLFSITIGFFSELFMENSPSRYSASGQVGGLLGNLFLSWLSPWGTFLFLVAFYLIMARGYFNIELYGPIEIIKEKMINWKKAKEERTNQIQKEKVKRKHTQELKAKIDSRREVEDANSNKNDF